MAARGPRSILIFLAIWCVGSVVACGAGVAMMVWSVGRAREVREASASAEVIEDEQLRFRLHRPGPGWRLVGRDEAAGLNADAEAIALHPDGHGGGVVMVERAYGADLARAAEVVIEGYEEAGFDLETPATSTLSGHEAMHASGYGELRGMLVRIELAVVVREDHIYQLYGWWPEPSDDPEQLTTHLFPALELLDGPVIDAPRRAPPADLDGALVQVRDGTFASAAYGLRVRGGDGWFVQVGHDLARSDLTAEAGLVREDPEIYLVVRAAAVPGADRESVRLRTREAAMLGASDAAAVEEMHTVAGAEVPFTRFRVEHGLAVDYAHGVLFAGDRALEIHAWAAAPGALDAHLAGGLARIELLTEAERDALEAASPGSRGALVGEGVVLRGGVFRGYPWGLAWRAPSSCWRGHVGEAAADREDGAQLAVECPRHAIHGALWIEPRDPELDEAAQHRVLVEDLFGPAGGTATVSMGDATALASRGTFELDGATSTFDVRSTVIGDEHVSWAVWGSDAASGGAEEARAALEAMQVDRDAPPEITSEPGYFEDRRLGFAIGDRASGVTFEQVPERSPHSRVISAAVPRGSVEVYAAHTGGVRSGDLAVDVVRERAVRDGSGLFTPEASTGTLAGEPCEVLTWIAGGRRHVMHSVTHGETLYGVITESSLVGGPDPRWVSTFRFVDP